MAQIKAKTSTSVDELRAWKLRLVRLMYERGYGRETIPLSSALPVCLPRLWPKQNLCHQPMSNDTYTHAPHTYHAQTFPLDPSPFLAPLTRHVPAPAHVLDVGCGSGRDLLWMKQRGYNLLGLERSPGLAKLARTHAGCEVLCADFDSFDFTTLSVDALILIGALVHVPKDRFPATLSRILQALKPGGPVLLTMKQGKGMSTAGDGQGLSGVRALEG
ncbi:class I SAM-dependent methyltransferase [Desulfonatronum thioautotrophicum]|uniref:class I SAM-dependent methyltransferase n=1 Tax=Desulfonatronum thioautotrophicum TaxID=617001 RepID=UPI0006994359|nr:methyltransferase domain-containing protein [Desulfonatronum thioautotrophicum]